MKNILLVGSGSDIASSLILDSSFSFVTLTSSESDFNILDPSTFPEIDNIDGMVYFPGSINLKPFSNLKITHFEDDYNINVLGLINILKFYQKSFNENSSIVLISSIAANYGMPFHSSISMCKAAIEGLTRSLAAEWAPKIRVNCIAPSLVETKLSGRLINSDLKRETISKKHPLNRFGKTDDISNAISFLLSEKSNWITAQTINIDGGLSKIR